MAIAWQTETEQNRFFDEAILSLPHLPLTCRNFDDVFQSMGLQIYGVKPFTLLVSGSWLIKVYLNFLSLL